MIFVDIKNDVAFRKIFGDQQKSEVLVSFLNAVLDTQGDRIITRVTLLNPFQLSAYSRAKATIIDVKARDQAGREYIVEMQVVEVAGLSKRMLYYTSRAYNNQIDSGEKYSELTPVILVGIFNFIFTKNKHYISHHKLMDTATQEQIVEDFEFHFIELPKFQKQASELASLVDKWVYFIKNARNLDVEPIDVDDDGLKTAYNLAKKYNWSKTDLDDYDYAAMREQDERGKYQLIEQRATEKGMEKGLEEGLEKGMKKVAEKLLKEGLDFAFISKVTQLSLERIAEIQNNISL